MCKRTRRDVLDYTAMVCSVAVLAPSLAFGASEDAVEHKIAIKAFQFEPAEIEVKVGDTITWANFDIVPHTATANDQSWDTGALETGQSMQVTVTDAMSTDYFCAFHPHMKANLRIVRS